MKKTISYFGFIKSTWLLVALGLGFNLLFGYMKTEGAVYLQKITDAIEIGDIDSVLPFVLLGGGLTFFAFVIRWLGAIVPQYLVERFSYEARVKLFEHLSKIPFITYEAYSVGELQSRIQNDSMKAGLALYSVFSRIFSNIFLFIFSIWVMAWTNLTATIVAVIIVVAATFINQLILKNMKKSEKATQQSLAEMTKSLESTFSAVETIKTAAVEEYASSIYLGKQASYCKSKLKVTTIRAVRTLWYAITENLCLYGSIGYLGYLGVQGTLSIGEVLMFIYLIKQIIMPIEMIFRWTANIPACIASMERINEILEVQEELETPENPKLKTAQSVRYRNLSFSYTDDKNIIDNLSFELTKNKITGISGESGSGKTTLLKLISGLYSAESGEYFIDGEKSQAISSKDVAYASIDKSIFPMSIYENICLGNSSITKERAAEILSVLGFSEWISSLPEGMDSEIHENLSGGQRQAVTNARAILSGRSVLIFDEPFSALDMDKEERLVNVLNSKKADSFVLVTSHRLTNNAIADSYIRM